ncbi:unnamed protein product [Protopolystoma xenopodis]|uniref:non-specific serine/threonine protein kinase n=1 Tax=Protopolystoma xenopodis TaxID=117903 RepID=A0A3S4ZWU2_9PLAT|nr:unnamed protein product [Protopolystoma xenopodis]
MVRKTDNGQLYAMKLLNKRDVVERRQLAHVQAERDILAEADNEWVVKLFFSFQDARALYLVMEYIPDYWDFSRRLDRLNAPYIITQCTKQKAQYVVHSSHYKYIRA